MLLKEIYILVTATILDDRVSAVHSFERTNLARFGLIWLNGFRNFKLILVHLYHRNSNRHRKCVQCSIKNIKKYNHQNGLKNKCPKFKKKRHTFWHPWVLVSFVDFEKINHKFFRGSYNEHSYQLAKLFRLRSIRFTDDD